MSARRLLTGSLVVAFGLLVGHASHVMAWCDWGCEMEQCYEGMDRCYRYDAPVAVEVLYFYANGEYGDTGVGVLVQEYECDGCYELCDDLPSQAVEGSCGYYDCAATELVHKGECVDLGS